MSRNYWLLLLWIFCLSVHAQVDSTDLFSTDKSISFARYLMTGRRFDMAAYELERVVYASRENDSARTALLQCYGQSGNPIRGIELMNDYYRSQKPVPGALSFEYERLLLRSQMFDVLDSVMQLCTQTDTDKTAFLLLNKALYSGRWQDAKSVFSKYELAQRIPFKPYMDLLGRVDDIHYKKPFIAAGLSALIPGLGKTYTRDWPDAVMSLILTGGLAWQAYRAFDKKGNKSVLGWVSAGFAFSFYAGNVYGSAKAAKDYNKRQLHAITDEADLYYYKHY